MLNIFLSATPFKMWYEAGSTARFKLSWYLEKKKQILSKKKNKEKVLFKRGVVILGDSNKYVGRIKVSFGYNFGTNFVIMYNRE